MLTPTMDDHHETNSIAKTSEDKPPHDASIFVGSLPSNIDQRDLTRMLMEHLSEHTQIKNVKVIRDSKGGVCAFVQCLDAASASALIETLYSSPPKPFLGRILRYEPARAFRTLLISYRTPIHLLHPTVYAPGSCEDQESEFGLPTAMRIWKHRNSRFHGILYNTDALQAEESRTRSGTAEPDDVFCLHPMKYDEETLRNLTGYFGSLESFSRVEVGADGQYPVPHNGPRLSMMDSNCWEIKWHHRDDCVSALMTLRRVPHLTVTWAHQPAGRSYMFQSEFRYVSGSPSYQSYPFRFRHRVQPPFISPTAMASPVGGFLPVEVNDRIPQQQYDQHLPLGRSGVYSPHISTSKRGLNGDVIFPSPKTSFHSQCSNASISLAIQSSEEENKSKDTEAKGHGPVCLAEADGQELFIPRTPALDSCSITPLTSKSQFPITPTISGMSYGGFAMKEEGEPGLEKQIDPTTLFVGGLETSGPGAWDEEKVRRLFSRFGGLEGVKFVQPTNATAAFAFVKFNNTDSPARAVHEEHNRVYEGRTLRVQLRDINPSRQNWKFGRGRGKFLQHQFNSQRRFNQRTFIEGQDHTIAKMGVRTVLETEECPGRSRFGNSPDVNAASESPPSTPDADSDGPRTEKYREWYDDLESPNTPPPSSMGSSASAACASFTAASYPYVPSVSYIPPPPWMQPYLPQAPYPLPYYPGYPLYPAVQQQGMVGPPSSDGVASAAFWPPGVSFVPYPPAPFRLPFVEQASQCHPSAHPPLTPNGFIQNEQGALIAVYQPEALNQFMAISGESSSMSHEGGPQKCAPFTPRPYNVEGIQPFANHILPNQGLPALNGTPFYPTGERERPTMPFQEGGRPINAMSNPAYRRPHGQSYSNGVRNSQNSNTPRIFTGRPGRGYMPTSYHGRGVQERPFGR